MVVRIVVIIISIGDEGIQFIERDTVLRSVFASAFSVQFIIYCKGGRWEGRRTHVCVWVFARVIHMCLCLLRFAVLSLYACVCLYVFVF